MTTKTTIDLEITGSGFYQLSAASPKGQRFMRHVQGNAHGTAYCDDSRLTQAIAAGAVAKGLKVAVNGQEYR